MRASAAILALAPFAGYGMTVEAVVAYRLANAVTGSVYRSGLVPTLHSGAIVGA